MNTPEAVSLSLDLADCHWICILLFINECLFILAAVVLEFIFTDLNSMCRHKQQMAEESSVSTNLPHHHINTDLNTLCSEFMLVFLG